MSNHLYYGDNLTVLRDSTASESGDLRPGPGRGGQKAALVEALPQGKPRRVRRRRTLAGSAVVPERSRIIHRPEGVGARLIPGRRV